MSDFPRTFVAGRLSIVIPTLVIIALILAGFAGWGPGGSLRAAATEPAIHWATGHEPHGRGNAALRRERSRERHRKHREERRKEKRERHAKRHGHHGHHRHDPKGHSR
jgi:hypothetical protein